MKHILFVYRIQLVVCLVGSAIISLSFQNCSGNGFKVLEATELRSLSSSEVSGPGSGNIAKQTCSIGVSQVNGRIYRKNKQILQNAISDVFGVQIAKSVESLVSVIPADTGYVKGFESVVNTVTDSQAQSYDAVASAIASQLASSDTLLAQKLGTTCKITTNFTNDTLCQQNLKTRLIEPLFSRLITAADLQAILAVYNSVNGTAPEKLEEMIYFILQDPRFIYSDMQDEKRFTILRELSRLIWYSVPDENLLKNAVKTEYSDVEISAIVDSMLQNPKSDRLLMTFFAQWLGLDHISNFNYASNFLDGVEPAGLRDAVLDEAKEFIRYTIIEKRGTIKDLFSSTSAKTNHAGLARIYEIAPSPNWQNAGSNRKGILSRAAILANGSTDTKAILRGVKITREILCNPINNPPPEIANMRFSTNIDPTNLTTRELNDARVSQSACMGCHSIINPYGHGLGTYDSLGRFSYFDKHYDANGVFTKQYPIDPNMSAYIDGGKRQSRVGVEFIEQIANSQQVAKCFDQQFYRFLKGSQETETLSCGWLQMTSRTFNSVPIIDVIGDLLKVEFGGKTN